VSASGDRRGLAFLSEKKGMLHKNWKMRTLELNLASEKTNADFDLMHYGESDGGFELRPSTPSTITTFYHFFPRFFGHEWPLFNKKTGREREGRPKLQDMGRLLCQLSRTAPSIS